MGNTTQQVDEIIQQLFERMKVYVRDHHMDGTHDTANKILADKVIHRLNVEHPNLIHSGGITYDRKENSILLSGIEFGNVKIAEKPTNRYQFGFK